MIAAASAVRRSRAAAIPPRRAFAAFGEGSWLVPPVRVSNPHSIAIGSGVVVLEHATLWVLADQDAAGARASSAAKLTLGDGVRLTRFNTVICEVGVSLGSDVASSDGATILDSWRHPFLAGVEGRLPRRGLEPAPVVVEQGAYLGMNSVVLPGVRVGAGAYVGECAVVFEDVPAHSVVYGNPATVVRRYDVANRSWEAVAGA
jgi:acetyltransferase-like isoleucine patch superfamily enzyme